MAHVVDDTTDDDDNRDEPVAQTAAPEAPPPAPEPEMPEKFKGKAPHEIAKAYHDLEQIMGRQAQELGELRKTADEYIRSALNARTNTPKAEPPKADSTDDDTEFFLNPKKAIQKAVEEHPLVKELRQRTAETQQERAKRTFTEKHPDYQDILKDTEFRSWVEKSPVRQSLLLAADQQYNVAAGDELFSTWKELKAAKTTSATTAAATTAADAARKEAVRAGTVPAGNATPSDGGKKIYRRADVIKLMTNDPERYALMADEIYVAYAEGRVR